MLEVTSKNAGRIQFLKTWRHDPGYSAEFNIRDTHLFGQLPYLDDPVRTTRLGRFGKPMGPLPPILPDATEPPARVAILRFAVAVDGMAALGAATAATGADDIRGGNEATREAVALGTGGARMDPRDAAAVAEVEDDTTGAMGKRFTADTRGARCLTPPRGRVRPLFGALAVAAMELEPIAWRRTVVLARPTTALARAAIEECCRAASAVLRAMPIAGTLITWDALPPSLPLPLMRGAARGVGTIPADPLILGFLSAGRDAIDRT